MALMNLIPSQFRRETTSPRPNNIFLIGAMKAGTTTLFTMLQAHPAICAPYKKEPNTLDDPECTTDVQFLRAFPSLTKHHRYLLDASTSYSKRRGRDGVPERIAALNGETKIIYLLRDPVERARSHYYHNLAHDPKRSNTLAQADYLHCIKVSRYSEQLAAYDAAGLGGKILLLDFEILVDEPLTVYRQTLDFLGLELPETLPSIAARNVNAMPKDRDHLLDWDLMHARLSREQRLMRERYGFRPRTPWSES